MVCRVEIQWAYEWCGISITVVHSLKWIPSVIKTYTVGMMQLTLLHVDNSSLNVCILMVFSWSWKSASRKDGAYLGTRLIADGI